MAGENRKITKFVEFGICDFGEFRVYFHGNWRIFYATRSILVQKFPESTSKHVKVYEMFPKFRKLVKPFFKKIKKMYEIIEISHFLRP